MNARSASPFLLLFLFSILVAAENNITAATATNKEQTKVGWKGGPTQRGTLMLVYGCLSTVFASTWTVLHLNLPGPSDSAWTKVVRKAKWMAINILFPEFIFSKAVCELRLAVSDLYDMHVMLNEASYQQTDTTQDGDETLCRTWIWKADFNPRMRLLYRLLGLPRLPKEDAVIEQGRVERSNSASIDRSSEEVDRDDQPNGTADNVLDPRGTEETRSSQGATEDMEISSDRIKVRSNPQDAEKQGSNSSLKSKKSSDLRKKVSREIIERQISVGSMSLGNSGTNTTQRQQKPNSQSDQTVRQSSSVGRNINQLPSQQSNESESRESVERQDISEERGHEFNWPKTRTWTLIHSLYGNMGGLLYEELESHEVKLRVATTHDIACNKYPIRTSRLQELVLEAKDIEDKSKADWLLKAIAVSQITWLMLNVAARGITKLPITQLEIATVAFSLMAIATYLANWWKPKDVGTATVLRESPLGMLDPERSSSFRSFYWRLRLPSRSKERLDLWYSDRVENDIIWMQGDLSSFWFIMAISSLAF
jgi:hypothetical protein